MINNIGRVEWVIDESHHFIYERLSLSNQFMVISLVILIIGMLGIGSWAGEQIRSSMLHNTGVTTALYVDSCVGPLLQALGSGAQISQQNAERLSKLLAETPMGKQIVALKVWDATGDSLGKSDNRW